jgi:alcohol dehydrogenase class IV
VRFEFATASRVVFGPGTVAETAQAAQALGRRALVPVNSIDRAADLLDRLHKVGVDAFPYLVDDEPTIESVAKSVELAHQAGCDLVIAMGGGSVLDTGKAAAALLTNPGDLMDYLEVIGKGKPLERPGLPVIAIPTTAGTGSEVTRNAVITSLEHRLKVSLRSAGMLPRLAIVDPQLTYSLPPAATASTGLDALTQLIEPFVSNSANPLVDAVCREGINRVRRSLQKAVEDGEDASAREDLALASLFSGLALANARLGAVHGLATPIGAICHAPHGAVCARLLPLVMETNLHALQKRQPNSQALERYNEIGRILTGKATAMAAEGIDWLWELAQTVGIQPLSKYGLNSPDYPEIARQAQKASSMKGNPVGLTNNELIRILEKAT